MLACCPGRGSSVGAGIGRPPPVNLVVPFRRWGTDAFARPLAAQFSKSHRQTLVIDNRGGAGGTAGRQFCLKRGG